MEMKTYIEAAEKKAGTQIKLAEMLGITTRYINMAKNGKRCLSVDTCIVLADYIGADRLEVIAASNLVTEKDERKRKIFESCFNRAATASVTAALLGVTSIMTLPSESHASSQEIPTNLQKYKLSAIDRRRKGRRLTDKLNNFLDALRISFLHNRNGFYKGVGNTF